MPLVAIRKSYSFDAPNVITAEIDMGGKIYNNQATILLQGYNMSYDEDHNVRICKARITNVTPRETSIDFKVEFDLQDDGDNLGQGTISVVAIADID